jgi:hypothetical protein
MPSEAATREGPDDKSASRTERRETQFRRRGEKSARSDRPLHLCSLAAVDVTKSAEGYQLGITSSGGLRTVNLAPNDVRQVLRDPETAIHRIRSQQ